MKKFRRFVSFILTFILISSTFLIGIQAAATDYVPTIEVSKASGKPGESISVEVSIQNNPGIAGYNLTVDYDETVLEFQGVEEYDIARFPAIVKDEILPIPVAQEHENNPGTISVVGVESQNAVKDDTLFTINFKIKSGATTGFYPIRVAYSKDYDIANENGKYVNTYIKDNGGVSVVDKLPGETKTALEGLKGKTAGEILTGVQAIGKKDLTAALEDETNGAAVLAALKELEKELTRVSDVRVEVPDGVTVVGAALNATNSNDNLTLSMTNKSTTLPLDLPNDYKDGFVIDITLTSSVRGELNGNAITVPVTITMPIPPDLIGKTIVILHYTGGKYVPIYPKDNQDGTMTFTVTSFSPFVFTSLLGGDIVLKDSTDYKINSDPAKPYLTGVEPGTTIADFLVKVKEENVDSGDDTKLYVADSSGNEITATTNYIGTGMKLKARDSEVEAIVVVYGDVTGTGTVTTTDVSLIYRHVRKQITLENEYFVAANVTKTGTINTTDVSLTYRYLRKLIPSLIT